MRCTKRNLMRDMPGYQGDGGTISEQCLRYVRSTEPKKAFRQMIAYLGGRGYNPFLDYGLLTLRLATYLKSHALWTIQKDDQAIITVMEKVPYYLLYDDRHDLWQNLPYLLDKITTGPEVWLNFCHILISCINESGTGDAHSGWTRTTYRGESTSDKEQYQIWIVDISRWHFGFSENWVYLIAAQTDADVIEIAKKDCGYGWRHRNQPDQPPALWKFYAQLFEPDASTTILVATGTYRA